MEISAIVNAQHAFFATGATKDFTFRQNALRTLRHAIMQNESAIRQALQSDLGKSAFESYMCETGLVLSELSYMEKHLKRFMKPRAARTPLAQFAAKSYVMPEPLGTALVMSPWNYPFMLSLDPVIGAIAAGNCVLLKPSAYAPATSALLDKMIGDVFDPAFFAVITGGRAQNEALLEQRFDAIFFTGSVSVGRLVMEKAARYLTPVTLELGGKSPCIVDETADLKLAARRIAFGKYLNAGQTCVAPDYLLVQESVREELLSHLQQAITDMFGADPLSCPDYGKIVNEKHYRRILGLIEGQKIVCGGQADDSALRIAPTVLDQVTPESPVMQEEIFGPVLPILTYHSLDEVIQFVNNRPKPLAFYLFTQKKATQRRLLRACSFGGGCINDTVIHLATSDMGFGGVGESGMGSYHGKRSFDTFTHYKSIVDKACWMDLPFRYQPYTTRNQKILRMFLK